MFIRYLSKSRLPLSTIHALRLLSTVLCMQRFPVVDKAVELRMSHECTNVSPSLHRDLFVHSWLKLVNTTRPGNFPAFRNAGILRRVP